METCDHCGEPLMEGIDSGYWDEIGDNEELSLICETCHWEPGSFFE